MSKARVLGGKRIGRQDSSVSGHIHWQVDAKELHGRASKLLSRSVRYGDGGTMPTEKKQAAGVAV